MKEWKWEVNEVEWNKSKYLAQSLKSGFKSFSKMPIDDWGKDFCHGVVIKRVDTNDVSMTHKPTTDIITTASWRTHAWYKQLKIGKNKK